MSKQFLLENDFGAYYVERKFAWLPTYINGDLGWLRFYWWQTLKNKDGTDSEIETGYWNDPRKNLS